MRECKRWNERITSRIAACTAMLIFSGLACSNGDRDRTDGRRVSDDVAEQILELDVKIALLEGMGEDSFDVTVDAGGDAVTLTGSVHEESSRKKAHVLATRAARGSRIRDRVDVKRRVEDPSAAASDAIGDAITRTADALTEARVRRNLLARLGREVLTVGVQVRAGVVSLDAPRLDDRERELARQTAAETSGVEKVLEGVSTS